MALRKKLAGSGYIVLNVIRALNIIALLAVVIASIIMLVKTVQISKVSRTPTKIHALSH